jgi:hypothetical protein
MHEIDDLTVSQLQQEMAALREKPIDSLGELQDEILKVLLFSIAAAKHPMTLASTAEVIERQREEVVREYQSNPRFHAFIKMECMELMRVIDRYKPR